MKKHPIYTTTSEYLKPHENPTALKNLIKKIARGKGVESSLDHARVMEEERLRQLSWLREEQCKTK